MLPTSARKKPICDVCNDPADVGGKPYTADQMRTAVQAGYRPPKRVMEAIAQVNSHLGLGVDAFINNWVNQVISDTTGWMLCPTCQLGMESALKQANQPHFCVFCKQPVPNNSMVLMPEWQMAEFVALGAMRHPGLPTVSYKTGQPGWIACLTCWDGVMERAKRLLGI